MEHGIDFDAGTGRALVYGCVPTRAGLQVCVRACVRVRVCVCARARACVRACVYVAGGVPAAWRKHTFCGTDSAIPSRRAPAYMCGPGAWAVF